YRRAAAAGITTPNLARKETLIAESSIGAAIAGGLILHRLELKARNSSLSLSPAICNSMAVDVTCVGFDCVFSLSERLMRYLTDNVTAY
ncbi:hypothetical protein AKJ16_DCAP14708, partial [Drosera capensis]